MLVNILIALFIGSLVGVLNHNKRNKGLRKPRNLKHSFDPGFISDLAWGAIAAVVAVLVLEPSGLGRVILASIAGGYAGEGIIANLEVSQLSSKQEAFKKNQEQMDKPLSEKQEEQ